LAYFRAGAVLVEELAVTRTGHDMKPQPEPSAQEVLAGLVERVTYHNAENRFCVAKQRKRLKENWLRSVNFRFYFEISM